MAWNREQIRQAYLDGELSEEESHVFKESLSLEEKTQLQAEKKWQKALQSHLQKEEKCPDALWKSLWDQINCQINKTSQETRDRDKAKAEEKFEMAIAKKLNEGSGCPDILWKNLQEKMKTQSASSSSSDESSKKSHLLYLPKSRWISALSMAAAIWFCLFVLVPWWENYPLAQKEKKTYQVMQTKGIEVEFEKMPSHEHHRIVFLEMKAATESGWTELKFSCCNRPVSVFVGKKDLEFHPQEEQSDKGEPLRVSKNIGEYTLISEGHHTPAEVLDFFREKI